MLLLFIMLIIFERFLSALSGLSCFIFKEYYDVRSHYNLHFKGEETETWRDNLLKVIEQVLGRTEMQKDASVMLEHLIR